MAFGAGTFRISEKRFLQIQEIDSKKPLIEPIVFVKEKKEQKKGPQLELLSCPSD